VFDDPLPEDPELTGGAEAAGETGVAMARLGGDRAMGRSGATGRAGGRAGTGVATALPPFTRTCFVRRAPT